MRVPDTTEKTTPEHAPASITSDEPLVSAEHVSAAIALHKRTIALHAQQGTLPHYRIGKTIRFRMSEVWEALRVIQPHAGGVVPTSGTKLKATRENAAMG